MNGRSAKPAGPPPPISQSEEARQAREIEAARTDDPRERLPKGNDYYPSSRFLPGERTLAEIEADLAQPLPERLIEWKPKNARGGGKVWLPFISWTTVQKMLTVKAPGWRDQYQITATGQRIAVACELCIPTADQGLVCRGGTGDDDEDEEGEQTYGTPLDRAAARALTRAAGKFYLGFYLRDDRLKPKKRDQ
jgi:hypothetical protein